MYHTIDGRVTFKEDKNAIPCPLPNLLLSRCKVLLSDSYHQPFLSFYVLFSPNSLQREILEVSENIMVYLLVQHFGISNVQYALLSSVYNIPNIVLCFFSGHIIEYLGLRPATILFSFLLLLGHILFTVSPVLDSFTVAVCGRMILGYVFLL